MQSAQTTRSTQTARRIIKARHRLRRRLSTVRRRLDSSPRPYGTNTLKGIKIRKIEYVEKARGGCGRDDPYRKTLEVISRQIEARGPPHRS